MELQQEKEREMEKRLYRSNKERMVVGVCGGLAQYFSIDPVIVRLIFVLSIFLGGLGIIAYIILAIVVPAENSRHSEPAETIRENVQEFKNTAETVGKDIHSTFNNNEKTGQTREAAVTREYPRHHGGFILGAVILAVGIIALLSTLGPLTWAWWFRWDYLWPVILIGAGLLIILVRRK
jgi:phage shock protein PspC (stress-responsive transcriptional regulator)